MGILDFFSSARREERSVAGNIRRANNKHTPKDYRQGALFEVIDSARKGNAQALQGLLARFGVNADPSIEDEKEKEQVCDALIEIGRPALPAIYAALRKAESVNWVQRVLRQIVSPEEYRNELLEVLRAFDLEYERNPDRKIQLIVALADLNEPSVAPELVRFLGDVNETVRYQTVVALAHLAYEPAREPLLDVLCNDESLRVRNQVVESFARLEWSTSGFKKKIDSLLPKGFRHESSGKIVRLGNA